MWHRLNRTLSILVVLVMLGTSLIGCGNDNSGGGTSSGQATTTTGTTGGETTATIDTSGGTTSGEASPTTEGMAGGDATPTTEGMAGGEATTTTGGAGGTSTGAGMTLPEGCSAVELAYWNPFSGPDGPFMRTLADKFSQENGSIKVTMTVINNNAPSGAYYSKLGTAAASGQLPDVAIVHADQIATMVFRNVLGPIDDLVSQMGVNEADYPPAVWQPGNVAGHRYSIPLDIHPMTMFYNEDLLKAANMTAAPKTADEFDKAAAALTSGNNHGFMLTTGFPVAQIFQQMLHQYGGSEFDAEGTKVTWNSDAGVQALQWMKDVQSKYGLPKQATDAELNAFKAGTIGMIWNGIWQTANMTGSGVEFAGKATSVPQIGPQMAVWAGSHQLTIPLRKTPDKCKDAASAMFIKYVVDNSVEWAKAGQIPANNKVRSSAEFMAVEPQASIATSVEGAFFPPAGVPGITDALVPLGDAVSAIMSGTATDIKDALDKAATRGDQILQQNKSTFGDAPKTP